jgi:small subunit ribosomal protein S10
MKNELKIKLYSYDHRLLDSVIKSISAIARANSNGIKGPIPLPVRRELFSFPTAPHVEKPAMCQFERRTHKRLIILTEPSEETIASLKHMSIPAGVQLKVIQA